MIPLTKASLYRVKKGTKKKTGNMQKPTAKMTSQHVLPGCRYLCNSIPVINATRNFTNGDFFQNIETDRCTLKSYDSQGRWAIQLCVTSPFRPSPEGEGNYFFQHSEPF